jgi:antitoxin (DNA-binding transcriptional repressor) of toxin-antitoxin stability system
LGLADRSYTCYTFDMKTMTVRDVRHKWSEVEASLEDLQEILVTKHSKPIAKIVQYKEPSKKRERFNVEEHKKWMEQMEKEFPAGMKSFDEELSASREERQF